MKKVLLIILLFIFCFAKADSASNSIIVDSNGNARWMDERKKTFPITAEILKTTTKILQEITIINSKNQVKHIYINKSGKIKKIEEEEFKNFVAEPIDEQKDAFYKQQIASTPKILINTERILRQNCYKHSDDSIKNKKEYLKMELLHGDYALWYRDKEYIAEYHKNGELMGLIKKESIVGADNQIINVFYEYRVGYNTDDYEGDYDDMGLKHILFLSIEKNNKTTQYLYLHNGNLLCRQINNNIYISEDGQNLLPDWSKKTSNAMQFQAKKYERDSRKTLKNLFIVATYPTWIVPPVGLMFFSVGNIIGGKDSMKKNSL